MTLTTLILWLLNLGYLAYFLYDHHQARRFGATLVAVRLRRRLTDALFIGVTIAAGLYYEITSQQNPYNLTGLALLLILTLAHGLRYPKWHLKENGFIVGARYWPYDAIAAMQLSEDAILVLTLHNGQTLLLPVAHIDDLEKAAAFFTDANLIAQIPKDKS